MQTFMVTFEENNVRKCIVLTGCYLKALRANNIETQQVIRIREMSSYTNTLVKKIFRSVSNLFRSNPIYY